jgi:hypothetical protein
MKHIMKIRLRKDGTWENVYDDNSSDEHMKQVKKLSEIAADYLDQEVEASGYRDAKEVLAYIKNKT